MSYVSRKREEFKAAKLAKRTVESSRTAGAAVGNRREAEIMQYLHGGGPSLPESPQAAQIRDRLVAMAQHAGGNRAATLSGVRAPGLRRAWVPALAKAAVVLLVAVLVLAGIGAASTSAMPGDPVYTVKRFVEGAHLMLLPEGRARADALLDYADERMDELEFTGARGMTKWYDPLASGAQSRIEGAYGAAARLEGSAQARTRSRARRAEERLQALINRALPYVSGDSRDALERVMERARRRIGAPDGGEPAGPGQDGGQQSPEAPGGQQDSQQQLEQQQQQQQQQQGQPPAEQSGPGVEQGQPNSLRQGNPENGMTLEQMLFAPQKNYGGAETGAPAQSGADAGKALQAPADYAGD